MTEVPAGEPPRESAFLAGGPFRKRVLVQRSRSPHLGRKHLVDGSLMPATFWAWRTLVERLHAAGVLAEAEDATGSRAVHDVLVVSHVRLHLASSTRPRQAMPAPASSGLVPVWQQREPQCFSTRLWPSR